MTVKDGIDSSKQLTNTLAKVAKLVNHIKKSTNAVEKLELKNDKGVVLKNDTRWNSQLKMAKRILELDLDDVTENKRELQLSAREKALLNSFVSIFEPFEIATDLLQGEHYSSISMVIPSYLGLVDILKKLECSSRYNISTIRNLLESLKTRLDMLPLPHFTAWQLNWIHLSS